jgi:hypothetical protein
MHYNHVHFTLKSLRDNKNIIYGQKPENTDKTKIICEKPCTISICIEKVISVNFE